MKWVWMMPLVDQPQIQNVRASAQNTQVRLANRSTRTATTAGEAVGACGASTTAPGGSP
jgi:hypothetical protein